MSVGLLVGRLLYCFYVFGHLSKWFTFSVYCSLFFVGSLSFTLAHNSRIPEPPGIKKRRSNFNTRRYKNTPNNHNAHASPKYGKRGRWTVGL